MGVAEADVIFTIDIDTDTNIENDGKERTEGNGMGGTLKCRHANASDAHGNEDMHVSIGNRTHMI